MAQARARDGWTEPGKATDAARAFSKADVEALARAKDKSPGGFIGSGHRRRASAAPPGASHEAHGASRGIGKRRRHCLKAAPYDLRSASSARARARYRSARVLRKDDEDVER